MRAAYVGSRVTEHHVNSVAAGSSSLVKAVTDGHSVLVVDALATAQECESLVDMATAAAAAQPKEETLVDGVPVLRQATRLRMPIEDTICSEGKEICELLLMRALSLLASELPELCSTLFSDYEPSMCFGNPELDFADGEPAINVYTEGGHFEPHEDKYALTVLYTLSQQNEAFTGGGTAFWSATDDSAGPSLVVSPAPGTALLFGGDLKHAGQRVLSGQRCVFVASFSHIGTPACWWDRK